MGIWRARRDGILSTFACAAMLLASECPKPAGPQSGVAIEYGISPQPARVGPAILTVKLHDTAGEPIPGARVSLEADMSHPGMAPVFDEAREGAPGEYQGALDFPMPGDWVVLIRVTLRDGRKLERQMSVPGVAAN
jgi:hypothetical protein